MRKFASEIPLHVATPKERKKVIVRMGARNLKLLHSWGTCCPKFKLGRAFGNTLMSLSANRLTEINKWPVCLCLVCLR